MATIPHTLTLSMAIKEAAPMMLEKLKGQFRGLFGTIEMLVKATKNWQVALLDLGFLAATSFLIAFGKAVTLMMQMNEHIAILGQRWGLSRKQGELFNAQLYSVAKSTGIVVDQLAQMSDALVEAGFKGKAEDLAKLSADVFRFSAVTGVATSDAAEFVAELSRLKITVGNTGLLPLLTALRHATFQLSTKEMQAIVKITLEATKAMYAYGNQIKNITEQDMSKFGASVAKTAAMMQDMGLSTEFTTKLLGEMTDPMKFLDNPALLASLGYNLENIQELLSGTGKNAKLSADTLYEMGQKMKSMYGNMSPLGLGAIAKIYGINAADMQRMMKMTKEERDGLIEKSRLADKLAKQQDAMNSMWKEMGEVLEPLRKIGMEVFMNFIIAMKPAVVVLTDFLKWINKGLTSFIEWRKTFDDATKSTNKFIERIVGIGQLLVSGLLVVGVLKIGSIIKGVVGLITLFDKHPGTGFNRMIIGIGKLGEGFAKFLKVFSIVGTVLGIAGTAIHAIITKKLTLNDIAMIGLSLWWVPGVGPWVAAISAAFLLSQALPNKFGGGFMKHLGQKNLLEFLGPQASQATPVSGTTAQSSELKRRQDEVDAIIGGKQADRDDAVNKLMQAFEKMIEHTGNTAKNTGYLVEKVTDGNNKADARQHKQTGFSNHHDQASK